eukprot:COSAG01_NODE_13974_length_1512_cov_2.977353_1_plen_140_part_00
MRWAAEGQVSITVESCTVTAGVLVVADEALMAALCQRLDSCHRRITGLQTPRMSNGDGIPGAGVRLGVNAAYLKSLMNMDDGDGKLGLDEIANDREASELTLALQESICSELGPNCPDPSVVRITGLVGPDYVSAPITL